MRFFKKKKLLLLSGFLFLFTVVAWVLYITSDLFPEPDPAELDPGERQLAQRRAALVARENAADQTVWAKEMLAQSCGRTFESLWDALNANDHKLTLLADFPFQEIVLPHWETPEQLPHGIFLFKPGAPGPTLNSAGWRQVIENISREGWRLETIEFRHNLFETDNQGRPGRSVFFFSAHLTRSSPAERAILEGDLVVHWAAKHTNEPSPLVERIDASRLEAKTRGGEPPFQRILDETVSPVGKSPFIDPLIVYDLDGDGICEIMLAGANLVYRRNAQQVYQPEPLCRFPLHRLMSAVVADFDGDGFPDLLCANAQGLFLFKGSAPGAFNEPPRQVWVASPPLENAMALTCGDVNEDGHLDVFIGQYKVPTLGEVLRPYYYDANDGWPAHLLLNDGQANFTEATEACGFGPKRWRRTYSASFADVNADGHLDLVVVSDFAGLDLYQNDGHAHFIDVTRQRVSESHAFGMSHTLADFTREGRLDLLMIGMPSPAVDRLSHLNLWRNYSPEDTEMRPAMAYGNRLYLAQPDGKFAQTSVNDSIARSGWSWGCSAFDFDNDGFPDLYIANGLESKQSVQDYEPEFWLHDIFVDDKIDDLAATPYFMDKFSRTRGRGWSYGGYEKNRLYLNQNGQSFIEIGHLGGVALEEDSRNVVAADLDGDGRMDLLLTTLEAWPQPKQTLKIFLNRLDNTGHWIGFRLREDPGRSSPVGATVTIQYQGHTAVRQLITGDSHRSQHPNIVHFGLGSADQVDSVEIRWLNGPVLRLSRLVADRYYDIHVPAR